MNSRFACGILVAASVLILATGTALAFEKYSGGLGDSCAGCHGDFRDSGYVSLSDGQPWGDDPHDVHRRTMLDSDCATCHGSGSLGDVSINASVGGTGLDPIGCIGCHGRAEDGTGSGTEGYGLAMQRRHWLDDNANCIGCHPGIDTATPVGENVLPPYYSSGHVGVPTDPCSPPPDLVEDFAGSSLGLDNDGDFLFDMADPDCNPTTATPGETSGATLALMRVTGHNAGAQTMDLSYADPCETTDNVIYFGPLASVASHAWSGQQCSIGESGSYVWNYSLTPDSIFFVVVGQSGSNEGSYGLSTPAGERPVSAVNVVCPQPQNLTDRCD